jgi:hypothetical protein
MEYDPLGCRQSLKAQLHQNLSKSVERLEGLSPRGPSITDHELPWAAFFMPHLR